MLHAAELHSRSEVSVAENLRSLIASASAQVEADQFQQQLEAQANLNGESGIFQCLLSDHIYMQLPDS